MGGWGYMAKSLTSDATFTGSAQKQVIKEAKVIRTCIM